MPAIVYRLHVTAADQQGRRAPVDVGEIGRRRFEDRAAAAAAAADGLAAMPMPERARHAIDIILAAD